METVDQSFRDLKTYCESQNFKGWDPYDGLNSTLFNAIPFLAKMRLPRLAWIQLFKRSPINFRNLTGVKKEYNPKGLGLFLAGYCNLYNIEKKAEYLETIRYLADKVIMLRSPGYSGSCWGYNFDWQARAFFQPKNTPTVVATTFIAYALMDAYDILKEEHYLKIALDTQHFIINDLNRTYDDEGNFAFSYSPVDSTQVYNASLLGSRLLSRIYSYTGDQQLLILARKSVAFCCKGQNENGSWPYGTLPFHQWIDNFHTGYNLECISEYQKYSGDITFKTHLDKGLTYYLETFFTDEGIPKYYSNNQYPVDIHNTSQLIITLSKLGVLKENLALVNRVLNWTINNMQDDEGYFYYQLSKVANSKIPYIRWAQAWMFMGFTEYFKIKSVNQ